MKRLISRAAYFCLTLSVMGTSLHCQQQKSETNRPDKIIIIRHAEKPVEGDNLSCAGFNRAIALADVLPAKFGKINKIYVPSLKAKENTSSARMYQTAIPLAVKYNLSINSSFSTQEINLLTAALEEEKGNILVVWEHKNILEIAKQLGISTKKLTWDNDNYDAIWIIDFVGEKPTLIQTSENIQPTLICP